MPTIFKSDLQILGKNARTQFVDQTVFPLTYISVVARSIITGSH